MPILTSFTKTTTLWKETVATSNVKASDPSASSAFMISCGYCPSTCDYAVCTVEGKHLTYDNFKKSYWKSLMEQLNYKHTPHETRHTFISQMVIKNVNQTILKKIVGHKSIMSLTENIYSHIEIQELLNEVNKI